MRNELNLIRLDTWAVVAYIMGSVCGLFSLCLFGCFSAFNNEIWGEVLAPFPLPVHQLVALEAIYPEGLFHLSAERPCMEGQDFHLELGGGFPLMVFYMVFNKGNICI